jgi:hypothetical protein
MKTAVLTMLLLAPLAWASADELERTDLVAKGKVQWSKPDGDAQVTVEISGGVATRSNPKWSKQPMQLAFDLDKNRELEREIKRTHPRGPSRPAARADERTLEVLVEGDQGWHRALACTLPLKAWRKLHGGALYAMLEPLLEVKPEQFETIKGPER